MLSLILIPHSWSFNFWFGWKVTLTSNCYSSFSKVRGAQSCNWGLGGVSRFLHEVYWDITIWYHDSGYRKVSSRFPSKRVPHRIRVEKKRSGFFPFIFMTSGKYPNKDFGFYVLSYSRKRNTFVILFLLRSNFSEGVNTRQNEGELPLAVSSSSKYFIYWSTSTLYWMVSRWRRLYPFFMRGRSEMVIWSPPEG